MLSYVGTSFINCANFRTGFNNMTNKGGAIADLDFKSAFDLLCMEWVLKVLKKRPITPIN